MPLNLKRTRTLLLGFDFKALFIEELGWDRYTSILLEEEEQLTIIEVGRRATKAFRTSGTGLLYVFYFAVEIPPQGVVFYSKIKLRETLEHGNEK